MADEDRVSTLRESLAAATFRIEGPLNMIASVVGMLSRRKGETDPMSVALADAVSAGQQALGSAIDDSGDTREKIGPVNVSCCATFS
ncbi:MAG: nitrogen fixation negative regulator NifL, partial [Candidatus Accumulibacter sp.]|nr:nitrogen fixation negative regulator NifL [Accumulibacter sp.]